MRKILQEKPVGIIKHSMTLFRGKLEMRVELMEAWRLRKTENHSSQTNFDYYVTLLWNHEYFDLELQGCNKTPIQKNSDGFGGLALSTSYGGNGN